MRRKLIDLMDQRARQLTAAENALKEGKQEDYSAAMTTVQNMNTEITNLQTLLKEQERKFDRQPPAGSELTDMMEERGSALMHGDAIQIPVNEIRRAITNAATLAAGTIVEPTGAGSNIRDPLNNVVSSILDQVYVQDLTGMGSYMEPYVITEPVANGGKVTTLAGTARAASADPTFGVAEIKPYEVNVTSFVDRNINRLSPANYYQKIYSMAMQAMRRKIADMIITGDGQASPDMHGIINAKNKTGNAIYAEEALSAIDVNTLDTLYFAYGSSEATGPNARMLLTKANLKAFGALRGANEKRRLLEITPDAGNPNTGVIRDGGVATPYTLTSAVGDAKLLYGDPLNYELGLFGEYSIRVDESVKAVERMYTILGDVMVGGNLIVDKGFVVATLGGAG